MKYLKAFLIFVCCLFITGCATILKGYDDDVAIFGASEEIEVTTLEGVKLETKRLWRDYVEPETGKDTIVIADVFKIRSNKDYVLKIKDKNKYYRVNLDRKLAFGYFTFGIAFGIVPAIYDGIAETWYYYDDIDLIRMNTNKSR